MAIYFATFAPTLKASKSICDSAQQTAIFDDSWAIMPEQLPRAFHNHYDQFMTHNKTTPMEACGVYQPYVLQKLFKRLQDGDILFYAAPSCILHAHPSAIARLTDYVRLAQQAHLVGFELLGVSLKHVVPPAIFAMLGITDVRLHHAPLVSSMAWLIQKGPSMQPLIADWLALIEKQAFIVFAPQASPSIPTLPMAQGIVSLLWHKYQAQLLCAEIYGDALRDVCALHYKSALGPQAMQSPQDISDLRQWHAQASIL